MRYLLVLVVPVLLLGGCPMPGEDPMTDPNTPTNGDGSGSGGGSGSGSSGGDGGSTDTTDPNDFVGPQPPEPNEPPAAVTQDLRVFVTFFTTGTPASSAVVTVRTLGFPFETLCTETTGFGGQITCNELPLGLVEVSATVAGDDGFPVTGSTQVILVDGLSPQTATVSLFP